MSLVSFTSVLTSLIVLTILSTCLLWPWLHATYTWRTGTIKSLKELPNRSSTMQQVPRIIHQTYRHIDSIPLKWQAASNSCRSLHSNYEYRFWSDNQGRRLIETEFPSLLPTFDSYPYDIQRADVIRLVVLYIYGGIYIDFDIFCLKSLDSLLEYEFILPQTKPAGLSNDVIISKRRHPFLYQVLDNLPSANRYIISKYPTVMFSTGPMFLTQEASKYPNRSSLNTLSTELYGKYASNSSQALFRHLKASSWHGSDASLVKWIYRWRNIFLSSFLVVVLYTIHTVQQRYNRTNNSMMKQ